MLAGASTINRLLLRAARHTGVGLRFLDRDEREVFLPWSEVLHRATDLCGALQSAGVRPGDRVAAVYPTGPGFFDAFFGALLAGAVPVPLYPPVRLGRLDEYHRSTGRMLQLVVARIVLADARVKRILGETIRLARPPLGCRTPEELPHGTARPAEPSPGDLALVQFSSGTTVDPKPVALSHRALVAQAELLNGFWSDRPGLQHSGLSWLPLYHDMGLVGCVFPAMERAATLTLIPPELFVARPAVWLRAISRYRATISPAPNFAYSICSARIRDEELDGVDLSCWEVALNGAEAVVPGVLRSFQERFAPWGFRPEAMTPVYGMSEAALAVTFSDTRRSYRSRMFSRRDLAESGVAREEAGGMECVSVGKPLPGFSLRIVDEGGGDLPDGHVGLILVQGPSLMEGYLDQPEATARAIRDGWLDTGDLGFLCAGELYLTSRAKDLLIVRGRNHAPEEAEHAVDCVPGVRRGCSVAVSHLPEGAPGEVLLLFVETPKGTSRTEFETIGGACRERLLAATGLRADRVVVLEAGTLPRTSSGKLRRKEALRRYLAGELKPPDPVGALRLLGAMSRSWLSYARLKWEKFGFSTE